MSFARLPWQDKQFPLPNITQPVAWLFLQPAFARSSEKLHLHLGMASGPNFLYESREALSKTGVIICPNLCCTKPVAIWKELSELEHDSHVRQRVRYLKSNGAG